MSEVPAWSEINEELTKLWRIWWEWPLDDLEGAQAFKKYILEVTRRKRDLYLFRADSQYIPMGR